MHRPRPLPRPRPSPLPNVRLPLSVTAAGALAAGCLLAAAPAQASVVNDTIPNDMSAVLAPAGRPAEILFIDNRPEQPSPTFPAGTYWILSTSVGLSGPNPDTRAAVTLAQPGVLTTSLPTVGPAGTETLVLLFEAPPGAGDPATMTPEEIDATLGHAPPIDIADISAANVPVTRAAPSLGAVPDEVLQDIVWADFHGIGADTPAYRLGNVWYVADLDAPGDVTAISFGRASDEAFVGDWDGNGTDTFAVHRGTIWYFDNDLSGGVAEYGTIFGRSGDLGLAGDWDGDETDTFGVRRGNVFHLRDDHEGGPATITFDYGRATDIPVVGDWDFDGKDTISVLRDDYLHVKNTLTGGPADEVLPPPWSSR